MTREIGQLATPTRELPEEGEPALTRVPSLHVDGRELLAWEEAIERGDRYGAATARRCSRPAANVTPFCFKGAREFEPVRDRTGRIVAALIRTSQTIEGVVEAKAEMLLSDVWKLTIGGRDDHAAFGRGP